MYSLQDFKKDYHKSEIIQRFMNHEAEMYQIILSVSIKPHKIYIIYVLVTDAVCILEIFSLSLILRAKLGFEKKLVRPE